MGYEQQFRIMIDSAKDRQLLIQELCSLMPDLDAQSPFTATASGNYLELQENEDYDPEMTNDPEDAFLYFRFVLGVIPVGDVDVKGQLKLAKQLVEACHRAGARAEVVADFEGLL